MSFEAAARLQSFTRAADELMMTQSAVSHQIKTLEELLGQPLFNRRHRGAVTTDAGTDLVLTVRECLGILDNGMRRLEQYKKPNQIIVAAPRSFAERVIVPHLSAYRALHPDHNVWLYTEDDPIDPLLGEVYVTVMRGRKNVPSDDATALCDDPLTPMAPPDLIERLDIRQPGDLGSAALLLDERREDWRTWVAAAGIEGGDRVSGYNFSDSGLVLQAAARGLGFALGSLQLARADLDAGRLVAPYPEITVPGAGYFMVSSPAALQLGRVHAFRHWLADLVGATAPSEKGIP